MTITIPHPIRLELPFALDGSGVNAYLFTEPTPTLIDTGDRSDAAWEALQAGLAAHGVAVGDLARVVITHAHIDHCGNAARIARASNARFEVLEAGRVWLTDFVRIWQERQAHYRDVFFPRAGFSPAVIAQLMVFYQQVADTYESVPAARISTFAGGDVIDLGGAPWRVLHTPGHASMLTCFHQPHARWLLSSDMLLSRTPTPVVETPDPAQGRMPALPLFVESLQQVAALAIDQVFPGHGPPFQDAAQVIKRQQARIERRKQQCYRFVASGTETPVQLMVRLYPGSDKRPNLAGLWMLMGYLDMLTAEGCVAMTERNGVWHYRAIG